MTPAVPSDPRLKLIYEMAEQRYLRSLPLEHFMESIPQATQREITLESFALIRAMRPEVQCFNELLVQFPRKGPDQPGQVVPDNMVVLHPEPIQAEGSFNLPFQPVGPFLVLEYISRQSVRKDYDANMLKYEQHLKVPYYLLFYPDADELIPTCVDCLCLAFGERKSKAFRSGLNPLPIWQVTPKVPVPTVK